MSLWQETWALVQKEWTLERRQGYAIVGLAVYAFTMVFLLAITFRGAMNPVVWLAGYWVLVMFLGVNAVAKSFVGEAAGQLLFQYQLARAEAIILAKLLYNAALMAALALFTYGVYIFLMGQVLPNGWDLLLPILVGGLGISGTLTLVSALVSQAGNRTTLMAVLSFPLLIPQLLLLVRFSRGLLLDNPHWRDLGLLGGLTLGVMALSLLLFPYLWRD